MTIIMKFTEILRLKKPEFGDEMSVEDLNDNADMIDETFNKKSNEWIAVTSGTSTAYTATLDPAPKQMYVGMRLTIIPHVTCSSKNVTLSVNGFDAKPIRQRGIKTDTALTPNDSKFMTKDRPVTLIYDGRYWIMTEYCQPSWDDVIGTPEAMKNPNALTLSLNGNSSEYTGETSVSKTWYAPTAAGTMGYTLVSNGSGNPLWRQPDYYGVCSDSAGNSGSSFTYRVQIPNFKLVEGVSVKVKFKNVHSTFNTKYVYLNVSGTGSYPLIYAGSKPHGQSGSVNGDQYDNIPNSWSANEVVEFQYIDSKWVAVNTEKVFNPQRIVVSKAYYYNSFRNMGKISDVNFICHGSDDTEIIRKAINACSHGGTIYFTGGAYNITEPIVLSNSERITFEGFSDNSGKGLNDTYGTVNICFNSEGRFTSSSGGLIRFKNLGLESSGGHIFICESKSGGILTFENVGIKTSSWNGQESTMLQVGTIYMRNSTYMLRSSSSAREITQCGICCQYIEVDNCDINLENYTDNTGNALNFIYSAGEGGVIRNSRLKCGSNYYNASGTYNGAVCFVCKGVSVENCTIDLKSNPNASITDQASTYSSLKNVFCNNIVFYYGTAALAFDIISNNVFYNNSSSTEQSIRLLKGGIIMGNRFFGKLGLSCSEKVLFSNNMLDYARHGDALPDGSLETNNLVG